MRIQLFTTVLLLAPAFGWTSEVVTPEKFMGGAGNLRSVLEAEFVSVESVSASPGIVDVGWENGHLKSTEVGVINWRWGMALTIEKGPVPMSASLALRIKKLFRSTYVTADFALSCGYLPCYRIELKEEHHTLEIIVIRTLYNFDVYRDGVLIGGRPGDMDIIRELDALLKKTKNEPNQDLKPSGRANK